MERATTHCMCARISIYHEQIRSTNCIIADNRCELSTLIPDDCLARFSQFLKSRTESVQHRITTRHQKKLQNLRQEFRPGNATDSEKWVINLSSRPLSTDEHAILGKGPKFALTPSIIPYKNIVAEIEAAITDLPDESKDAI